MSFREWKKDVDDKLDALTLVTGDELNVKVTAGFDYEAHKKELAKLKSRLTKIENKLKKWLSENPEGL